MIDINIIANGRKVGVISYREDGYVFLQDKETGLDEASLTAVLNDLKTLNEGGNLFRGVSITPPSPFIGINPVSYRR